MKLASTTLQTFLSNMINTPGGVGESGVPTNLFVCDLYTFVTGSGRIVLNEKHTPVSGQTAITPPLSGTYIDDLGVRQTNGDNLAPVSGTPSSGQYTFNTATGVYTFFSGDSGVKLISYVYQVPLIFAQSSPNILRIASTDRNVVCFGKTFTAGGMLENGYPAIQRSKISMKLGLEVSQEEIEIYSDPSGQINSTPILQYIIGGQMDGATIYIQRGFSTTPDFAGVASMGPIIAFSGTVAESEITRISAKLTIKSRMELLDLQMPRVLYSPGCQNVLFDGVCKLLSSNFQVSGTVSSGSTAITINTSLTTAGPIANPTVAPTLSAQNGGQNLPAETYWVVYTYTSALGETSTSPPNTQVVKANQIVQVNIPPTVTGATGWNVYIGQAAGNYQLQNNAPLLFSGSAFKMSVNGLQIGNPPPLLPSAGYWDQGVISFTSGVNKGVSRTIANYAAGGIITVVPTLAVAPGSGDSFTVVPGCDKSKATCQGKFNNLINFRGEPYLPLPETGI